MEHDLFRVAALGSILDTEGRQGHRGAIPLNVQGDEQGISVFIKDSSEEANGEKDERLHKR